MKTVKFENAAYDDFVNWATLDKAIFRKIADLIKDIDRNGAIPVLGNPNL